MTSTARAARHAAAGLFFLGVAVFLTWPLVGHLHTHIPGLEAGDNVSFVWNLWWFREQVSWLRPFDCALLFAPFGTSLVLSTHTALPGLLAATLLRPLDVIAAQNVIILAGLTLNGFLAYGLARRFVAGTLPALLAGTTFSGAAYVSVHLLGHFNLIHAWTLPLFALAWIPLVERPSRPRALRAGAALAVVLYTDYYYAVFAATFAAVWWMTQAIEVDWQAERRKPPARAWLAILATLFAVDLALAVAKIEVGGTTRNLLGGLWLIAAAAALVFWRMTLHVASRANRPRLIGSILLACATCAVMAWPIAVAAVRLIAAGDYVTETPQWLSGARGVDVASFVFGHPLHSWIGPTARRLYAAIGANVLEQTAWLGLVPLALLAATWRRTPRWTRDPWAVVGLVFLIWTLGPFLTIARFETGLVLPQALLRFLPVISNARIPGRALIVVQLAMAVLCAKAAGRLRLSPVAITAVLVVALADSATAPYPLYRLPPPGAVERYLQEPGNRDGAVLELPAGVADGFGGIGLWDQRVMAWQMAHRHPLVGGSGGRTAERIKRAYLTDPVLGRIFEMSARRSLDATRDAWPADATGHLRELGVRFVAINRDSAPAELVDFALANLRLRLAAADGPRELYEIR